MGIGYHMGLRSDYSQEVVAQFYATLYVDRDENEMHFTLGGKRFSIFVSEFASLFKLRGATTNLEVQPQPTNSFVNYSNFIVKMS
jgi:hypothetical protein